jgi:hypothetical protein
MSQLGETLQFQGRYAEAEPLVVQGYLGMRAREAKIPASGKRRFTDAGERVMRLYQALGQPRKATAMLRKEDLDAMMPNGAAAFAR